MSEQRFPANQTGQLQPDPYDQRIRSRGGVRGWGSSQRFYYQPQGVTDGEEKLAKAIHEVALAGHGAIESGVFSQEQTCPPLVHTLIRVAENRLERGELFVAESWMVAW